MIQFLPVVQIAVASASAVLPHRVGVQPTPIFDEQEDLLSAIQVRSTITARVGSEWRVQADGVSAIPVARQSDGFSHYHYLLTYQDTPWLKPFGLTFTYGQMQRLVKAFQDLGFDFNWSDYPASRTDAFQGMLKDMMDRSIFPGTGEFCNLIVCPEKFCNLIRDAVLSKLWHVSSVVSSASGGVGHYTYLLTYQGTHGKAFPLSFRLTFTYDQMLGWVKAFQDLGFDFNLRRPFRELHTDAFQGILKTIMDRSLWQAKTNLWQFVGSCPKEFQTLILNAAFPKCEVFGQGFHGRFDYKNKRFRSVATMQEIKQYCDNELGIGPVNYLTVLVAGVEHDDDDAQMGSSGIVEGAKIEVNFLREKFNAEVQKHREITQTPNAATRDRDMYNQFVEKYQKYLPNSAPWTK